MVQTGVTYMPSQRAFEGQIANLTLAQMRSVEMEWRNGQTTFLPFGRAVVASATANEVQLPATGRVSPFLGVAAYSGQYWNASESEFIDLSTQVNGYPPGYPVSILTTGDIFVWSETAVTYGSTTVYFRHAGALSNGNSGDPVEGKQVIGRFTTANEISDGVADAGVTAISSGVKWRSTTTGAGLAILSLWGV